jgi:nitrogen fixation NifU-like protein
MALDLYAEEIVSHYEHPHNAGVMKDPSASFHNYNASCGDDITMYLKLDKDRIVDAKFKGSGCAVSVASASMLTDFVKGKSLKDVEAMGVKTIIDIIGIDPGPARLKCATLPLRTLKEAVFLYEHKEADRETKAL